MTAPAHIPVLHWRDKRGHRLVFPPSQADAGAKPSSFSFLIVRVHDGPTSRSRTGHADAACSVSTPVGVKRCVAYPTQRKDNFEMGPVAGRRCAPPIGDVCVRSPSSLRGGGLLAWSCQVSLPVHFSRLRLSGPGRKGLFERFDVMMRRAESPWAMFQGVFSSSEESVSLRCCDWRATGRCQPCLIAMKRRPKHKAVPARAEMP